jgi:hypothetical protein
MSRAVRGSVCLGRVSRQNNHSQQIAANVRDV